MLKDERYDRILQIVDEKEYVSANELAKTLYVSMPTIRRDLAELHAKQLLLRSHGGAKKIKSDHKVTPLDFRKTLNISEKRRICEKASALINDNDIIFIDASSTAMQLIDYISGKKNLTVITNGIPLAALLMNKGIKAYCTGGEIQTNSLAMSGSFAEDFIRSFNIDTAFFSCFGVNSDGMIVDASLSETMFRKVAIRHANKSVFLCDSSKFDLSAAYNLMPIDDVDVVVTTRDDVDLYFGYNYKTTVIKC